jgi:hypothetical protein
VHSGSITGAFRAVVNHSSQLPFVYSLVSIITFREPIAAVRAVRSQTCNEIDKRSIQNIVCTGAPRVAGVE